MSVVAAVLALVISWAGCDGPLRRVDASADAARAGDTHDATPQALLVTLTGLLGSPEVARCHRALREAEANGCAWVVFRLREAGAFGEDAADLESLYDRLQSTPVATAAVLEGRVTYGGAGIALWCRERLMTAGASWGELAKPDPEIAELLADDPEQVRSDRLDAAREAVASRLQRRETPLRADAEQLALGMADQRLRLVAATVRENGLERARVLTPEQLVRTRQSGGAVFGEEVLPQPVVVTAAQAEVFGLSTGTIEGFHAIGDWLSIDPDRVGELTVNWAENMVAWLELLSPFLLVAGFLMLLLEIKTPGTGLPGLLGVVFLGLAMFHSYLVGLAEITEILVFFLGLAAIAVEIFLLPGTVVFGLVGFLCLVLSLILSRQSFVLPSNAAEEAVLVQNLFHLVLMFVATGVLTWLMWRLLPQVPVFNRMILQAPGDAREPERNSAPSDLGLSYDRLVALVGRTGRAATVLRPAGTMAIDDDRVDVVTEGEFVEHGAPLRVLYVQGSRVVVARDGDAPIDDRSGEDGSVGLVLLLCIVGLVLIFAEVIFVSMGALGIAAGACLLGAIFVAFQESVAFGVTVSLGEAIAAPVMIWLSFKVLPKTPMGKHLILSGPPTDGHAAAGDGGLGALLHKTGTTTSTLRPSGFAKIDGRKVDVVTRGEMLPKDCPIVVLDVSGNRVVVGRDRNAAAADPAADAPLPGT